MKLCLVICSAEDKGIKVKYLNAISLLLLRGSPLLVAVAGYGSLGNALFWMVFLTRLTSLKLRETPGDSLTSAVAFQHRKNSM